MEIFVPVCFLYPLFTFYKGAALGYLIGVNRKEVLDSQALCSSKAAWSEISRSSSSSEFKNSSLTNGSFSIADGKCIALPKSQIWQWECKVGNYRDPICLVILVLMSIFISRVKLQCLNLSESYHFHSTHLWVSKSDTQVIRKYVVASCLAPTVHGWESLTGQPLMMHSTALGRPGFLRSSIWATMAFHMIHRPDTEQNSQLLAVLLL